MAKPKHQKTAQKENELFLFRSAVDNLRELFNGQRKLGTDFALASSVTKVSAVFAAAASRNHKDWEGISARLGNPSPETCEFIVANLKEMQGAIFRRDQNAVDRTVSALEGRSLMAMLEGQISKMSGEVEVQNAADVRARVENAIHDSRARADMKSVPAGLHKAVGYGLAEVSDWDTRFSSIKSVLSAIDSAETPSTNLWSQFRTVAKVFAAVAASDTADWYSLSRFLGHPSSAHCRSISNALYGMAEAVRQEYDVVYPRLREFVVDGFAGEMLETYLGMASGKEYQPEEGMVYIAWSSSDPSTLQIGISEGLVDDELRILREETGHPHRYGLLATWLVHDVDHARETLAGQLRQGLLPNGGYSLGLGEAKNIIGSVLEQSENLVLSPWHDDNEVKPKSLPSLTFG